MLDRTEEASAAALAAEERLRELGHTSEVTWLGEIALVAGDLPAAAEYLEAACDAMEDRGLTGTLSGTAARLGQVLCRLGRHDEAQALAEKARELTDPDDVWAQVYWRQAQALVQSARGQHVDAERLAREAVSWAGRSDSPVLQGDALGDLAEVLEAAGLRGQAITAWQEALDRYERKQIVPIARRTRERLTLIQQTHE